MELPLVRWADSVCVCVCVCVTTILRNAPPTPTQTLTLSMHQLNGMSVTMSKGVK